MSSKLPPSGPASKDDFQDDSRSTISKDSDVSNEEGWEDVEPEDDSQAIVGLFSGKIYPDVRSMLKESKEKHNFDLWKIQKELGV